jgi:hypothetical protein
MNREAAFQGPDGFPNAYLSTDIVHICRQICTISAGRYNAYLPADIMAI